MSEDSYGLMTGLVNSMLTSKIISKSTFITANRNILLIHSDFTKRNLLTFVGLSIHTVHILQLFLKNKTIR